MTMLEPYRENANDVEQPLPWWEREKPSQKEMELWQKFLSNILVSSRSWQVGGSTDPIVFADLMMKEHRKRFGVI